MNAVRSGVFFVFVAACVAGLALEACSSSSSGGPDGQAPVEAGDEGVAKSCAVPPAHVVEDPDAATLAASAGLCGAASFEWRSDATLGDPKTLGASQSFVAAGLSVLVAASKVTTTGPALDVTVQQLAYVTQDRGEPLDATALVAFPTSGAPNTTYDVLLVLHGTAGFTDACAPSADPSSRQLIAALASLGFVVVAPDYIGLRSLEGPTGFLHPYLVAQPTAVASLDAVRAAEKLVASRPEPLCTSKRFAVVGGSQGGLAALFVDRFAPYYAPELELVGTVATVPPADMVGEANRALTQEVPASENTAAFLAASSDWYGTRQELSQALVPPLDTEVPDAMATTCDPSGLLDGKPLDQIFSQPLLAAAAADGGVAAESPFGCLFAANGLTTTSLPRVPPKSPSYDVLFVLGSDDTLVTTPLERVAFQTLCAQGMKMHYLECSGASHTKTSTWALPEIVDFIRDRFAGKLPDGPSECQVTAPVTCAGTP